MSKMELMKQLTTALKQALDGEDIARMRGGEWRRRRQIVMTKITEVLGEEEAHEFLELTKRMAGHLTEDDYYSDPARDADPIYRDVCRHMEEAKILKMHREREGKK